MGWLKTVLSIARKIPWSEVPGAWRKFRTWQKKRKAEKKERP